MISNYIICATPRSGSNLLCELLSSLRFAGKPEEHLWDPEGIPLEPLAERWPRVLETGTGQNGVFGLKLMWYQAERLERELPEVLGFSGQPLGRVLAATLADPKYVFLTRRDRLRQAISHARAIQTGQWRSMDAISSEPRYDAEAISGVLHFLKQDEANWESFFTRQGVAPYRLTYEEIDSNPQSAIEALLQHLGHDGGSRISLPASHHRRQADAMSEEWLRRYTTETAKSLPADEASAPSGRQGSTPAWYTAYYGEQYADSVRGLLTPERTAAEVAFIRRITGLQPPASVADVACGEGRHARVFAAQGFDVTGVDQNADFIDRARIQAPDSATFLVGDMREAVGGPYQLVLLLYHSFGFFPDEENRRVLQQWSDRLDSGGWFVIDVWNRDAIVRRLQLNRVWQASADLEVDEDYGFDPLTGRLAVHYTYIYSDGRRNEYDASFRLYTFTELRDLFESVGMTIHSVFGSLTGEPYSLDARRMVLFAQKAASPARVSRLDDGAFP